MGPIKTAKISLTGVFIIERSSAFSFCLLLTYYTVESENTDTKLKIAAAMIQQ